MNTAIYVLHGVVNNFVCVIYPILEHEAAATTKHANQGSEAEPEEVVTRYRQPKTSSLLYVGIPTFVTSSYARAQAREPG